MPELRKALPVHHTPTSTGAWDGPAAKANLKKDQPASYYKGAFAWVDPNGDPKAKSTYKFIHHEVDSQGTIGAANLKACSSSIGILNGGRGGTKIPDSDKKGVWNHVAAHMKDAKMEPPELKSVRTSQIERRTFNLTELRVLESDDGPKIEGHAAVFNILSLDLGGYKEKIQPGAFAKTIKESDIRALWNHNMDIVLGRNRSGTLKLVEDVRGLAFAVDPPDWAGNHLETIRRGDVDQMSFAFRTIKDAWENEEGKETIRTLVEVELFDISPVTFPAYIETDVQVRSVLSDIGISFDQLAGIIVRATNGISLTSTDTDILNTAIEVLKNYLPVEPQRSALDGEAVPISMLRRRLEIAEKAI